MIQNPRLGGPYLKLSGAQCRAFNSDELVASTAWATEEEKSSERISNNSKNSLWEKPKFSCISMAFCLFGITQFYSETIKGRLAT